MMEGKDRPKEETEDDAGMDGVDTEVISPAPLFTPGLQDTPGRAPRQRQAAFHHANSDILGTCYPVLGHGEGCDSPGDHSRM